MCNFVFGIMSHAKTLFTLQWSVIHYQVTFECYSRCGSETSIASLSFIQSQVQIRKHF